MLALRRTAFQSAGIVGASRASARYSTGKDDHGHSSSSGHDHSHHAGPKDESLGIQLYVTLAVIPFSYGLYMLSRPAADGTPPAITTRIIDAYESYKQTWADRNTLHTEAIEQAGYDRALFFHSKPSGVVDLRFPEIFNTGSPYNVVAGQQANLDKLVEHYTKLNEETEEKKANKANKANKEKNVGS